MDPEAKRELRRLLRDIQASRDAGAWSLDLKAQYELCEQAYPYLESYISEEELGIFEVSPVVEHLARCYAATINTRGVERICEFIYAGDPTLAFGAFIAERAVKELEYASQILDFVNSHPGMTQFAAREMLGIPKADMANVLRYMEACGAIRRTPTARTNRLYPGHSTPVVGQ